MATDPLTKEIAARNARALSARMALAAKAARAAADSDRSDPFIYGRVHAHMMNGIGEEHAYAR